ncbi:hypothetical protein [Beijerinckia indica]|uniref:Uncharacterized protein n=1 Tax=Beijerinckia indica subsp. indica (strain ATCC 9039 / DSM 1715 / NCIMB 8712) TaxID=395963 RepID=B2IL74_BEII9|nr:hypothetical protein [Beijerinckia indica]ACB97274.1 conserved hypothetical protein [Beijerinckia indica subsp. indica ATCC 9039]
MADYSSPTVIQQTIPEADMTELEKTVLLEIFQYEEDGNGFYLFHEESPQDLITIEPEDYERLLAIKDDGFSSLRTWLLENRPVGETDPTELDMSDYSYEYILQDIVKRSKSLDYITVVTGWTCSKMRSDGFGGMASFITADEIKCHSTTQFLEDCMAEFEKDASPEKKQCTAEGKMPPETKATG